MSDENEQNEGLRVAHPPAETPENPGDRSRSAGLDLDQARAAKVGTTRAMAEAAMAGLAERIGQGEAEPEQPSLLLADPDDAGCLFAGPVKHVAKTIADGKRARGRPAGSQNKRSQDLANYLLAMGYRDPALNLADLANADPLELAAELSKPYRVASGRREGELVEESMTPADALALIMKANAELMPYFHAKRPQEIHVESRQLGIMIVGDMPSEKRDDSGVMDLTRFDAPDE